MLANVRKIASATLAAGLATLVGLAGIPGKAEAAEVRGSLRSMTIQHGVAKERGYTFLRNSQQIRRLADQGELVLMEGNDDYLVHGQVTHPYARPEVKLLIERLAAQYRDATGERLVVTSLVRPTSEQPANAHRLSVHPVGMAVDLRVPANAASRQWLQDALLGMERAGVLDVTREYRPPHYHVAVFPEKYAAYAAPRIAAEREAEERVLREAAEEAARAAELAAASRATGPLARATALDTAPGGSAEGLRTILMLAAGGGLVAIPFARRRRRTDR